MQHRVDLIAVVVVLLASTSAAPVSAFACATNADCGSDEVCEGVVACGAGTCVPVFTMSTFPLAGPSGETAYTAPLVSVMDHSGTFYTACCDTRIVAFTGEAAERNDSAAFCPVSTAAPACLFATCLCGYTSESGEPFDVTAGYSSPFGPSYLYYDGHAGYDFSESFFTPIAAAAAGSLCKAVADPVNGTLGQPTAWDGFHTFYVDHGAHGAFGWSSWYLHAEDLQGMGLGGEVLADLEPGECAPVAEGQVVAAVGNFGTGSPHLHFEVRRYAPSEGPEATSVRVVDPYGWRGAEPDPLTNPSENFQAAAQKEPLWIACGNGRVECGEQCDDGNTRDGDCCDSTCALLVAPAGSCRETLDSAGASLSLRDRDGGDSDRLRFKWSRGEETLAAAFGAPTITTGFALCVIDESSVTPRLVLGARAPAGGSCAGTPCWRALGNPTGANGYRYTDKERTPDGIERLQLMPGVEGKARIVVKGRGANLGLTAPVPSANLRVQVRSDEGDCWEASF
jgi:cysteine-rich repeat protein